jgi:3-dehydroquinate synthase
MSKVRHSRQRRELNIGPGRLDHAATFCAQYQRLFVLSDANVGPLYGAAFAKHHRVERMDVPTGEASKSFQVLEHVLDRMAATNCDRKSGLVALGGGVVGDLGGLAAALYMRGIDCVQAPTSLLAMVDSSVGGKTAVNLHAGKNLAGTFHFPRAVFADTSTLATLPLEEYRSGLGEVVKMCVLSDAVLEHVDRSRDALLRRDPETVARVVDACVQRKERIVDGDPHDEGPRKILNLGHTFAHAIEHQAGYGAVPHGIAVGVGLGLAFEVSRRLKFIVDDEEAERVAGLLETFGMPRTLAHLEAQRPASASPLEARGLMSAMKRDKKSVGGNFRLVLPATSMTMHDVPVPEAVVQSVLEASLAR